MTAQEIIEKWLKYSRYDPDEHSFNLFSTHYSMHRTTEKISKIMEYDPQCTMSVLYVKSEFEKLCKEVKISAFDILSGSTSLDTEDFEMWRLLHSEFIEKAETDILDAMGSMLQKSSGKAQVGERDMEKERVELVEAVTSVVEELQSCQVDLFLRGGKFTPITSFNTQLHIFNTLSECLYAIENAPDAAYICYISNNGTADGYFGFFLKSNGNLLSINERVDERYPGQHANSRNGRWTEAKKYSLFPYGLVTGERFDYKGYAQQLIIDDSELELFRLAPDSYLPLILGLIMLNNKYAYVELDIPTKYIDALLPVNLQLREGESCEALIPLQNSLVAKEATSYCVNLTSDQVLAGSPSDRFTRDKERDAGKPYDEFGCFLKEPNIFVQLYGDGFELDTSTLLKHTTYLALPKGETALANGAQATPEFVGTENRLDLIAYYEARRQLAEYIRDRMYEEYVAFGGVAAVQKWYDNAVMAAKDRIIDLCAQKWMAVKSSKQKMTESMQWSFVEKQGLDYIHFFESKNGELGYDQTGGAVRQIPFNTTKDSHSCKRVCPVTGALATIHFILRPDSWEDMEEMLGVTLPKVLKGYIRSSVRRSIGNSLLDVTDAVAEVGNVFEENEIRYNPRLRSKKEWHNYYFRHSYKYPDWPTKESPHDALDESPGSIVFPIEIAFSKRGWAKILKERNS